MESIFVILVVLLTGDKAEFEFEYIWAYYNSRGRCPYSRWSCLLCWCWVWLPLRMTPPTSLNRDMLGSLSSAVVDVVAVVVVVVVEGG